MPPEVSAFITNYGYLAIFLLIFIQELGVPNPLPNELVLMFSGYLAFKGILNLLFVILVSVSADIIGTGILYTLFYFLGNYILKHKPRWFPLSDKSIEKYSSKISKGGKWTIYICRVTPFVRGYTSIIAGMLQIKSKIFSASLRKIFGCRSVIFIKDICKAATNHGRSDTQIFKETGS